jgi:fibronectin-binding autotransporter adhesin
MLFLRWTRNVKLIPGSIRTVTAMMLLLCATSALAQLNLTWDPTANGGSVPASGNWDTVTTNWWNGSADIIWSQNAAGTVSVTNAIFGGADAAAGTYNINVASQIAVSNIVINYNGYVLSGSGPLDIQGNGGLQVATGKTTTLSCPTVGNNTTVNFLAGAGSVLNVQNTINNGDRFVGTGTINLSSSLTSGNAMYVDCGNLDFTSGTWTQTTAGVLYLGYSATYAGITSATGTLTVNGGTINDTGNKIVVCRSGGTGTLVLQSGAVSIWTGGSGALSANAQLAIPNNDNNANNHASVVVDGGVLTLGNSSYAAPINMMSGGSSPGETAFLTQTGGVVYAYGGIMFGATSGTYNGGLVAVTNSGGNLYLGANGFNLGASHAGTNLIALSGGIVGALANWSSVMPMALGTLNGNITFQCADNNNNPWNISLSGPLTGSGGLNVTGGGTLTLSGANSYTGSTTVSNGTLLVITPNSGTATDGSSITVDGSAGAPTLGVQSTSGQFVSTGPLAFQNGSTTLSHSFGSLPPSTSVAPIQISGNVDFAATPTVNVSGVAIPVGTYPLISCTGGMISGTPPTGVNITLAGGSASGHIASTSTTMSLVVTASTYKEPDFWRTNSNTWDFTSFNWYEGTPANIVKFVNGAAVAFDDTAAGPFPITITNDAIVSPNSVTANNTSGDNYTITGTGSISGAGSLSVLGGGTLTLTEANTYSGGTILASGQLNVNNGGDSSSQDSAIGTGPLTINAGAALDNTSGSNITLIPAIPETWNGNFIYVGSSNNFDAGSGAVALGNNVVVTVNSNTLEVDGGINDNGNGYGITKSGDGALTLMGNNSFFGNFELASGQVNIGTSSAIGGGLCLMDGGSIDNYSGGPLTISSFGYTWAGSFSYLGTSNSLNLGTGNVTVTLPTAMTLNIVSNTLVTPGNIIAGNTLVHKTGLGTWDITGFGVNSSQDLGLSVDQGTVLFDKNTGFVINHPSGLLIQSNALVYETGIGGPTQPQVNPAVPVVLNTGGTWDLNGNSETVSAFTNSNGVLRNSSTNGSISDMSNSVPGNAIILTGTDCVFDVTNAGAVLNINAIVAGTGSLVKTGNGLVDLLYTNAYTGNTTVNGGILELNAACVTNMVAINTNAVMDLNFAGTDPIAGLTLGGTNQPPGLYNAITAPAFITGTGSLQVTTGAAGPTLTSVTPDPVTGSTYPVTLGLTGGGFTGASAVLLTNLSTSSGASYSPTVNSDTSISVSFVPGTASSSWNATVVNGSPSAQVGFTVSAASQVTIDKTKLASAGAGNVVLNGTGGAPGNSYAVLSTTSLNAPVVWLPVVTNTFDGSGNFNYTNAVNKGTPKLFLRIQQ